MIWTKDSVTQLIRICLWYVCRLKKMIWRRSSFTVKISIYQWSARIRGRLFWWRRLPLHSFMIIMKHSFRCIWYVSDIILNLRTRRVKKYIMAIMSFLRNVSQTGTECLIVRRIFGKKKCLRCRTGQQIRSCIRFFRPVLQHRSR